MGFFSRENDALRRYNDEIEYRRGNPEHAVRKAMDRPDLDGFKWKVWWVAASGFFTTSYSIFAANVISPALNYVYPECKYGSHTSLILNLTTLCGTMLGMIVFGVLTDKYGRKSIYGLELTLVVIATIGMTTASTGANNAMNIYGWIGFWRCLLGIGLGAEYPLSAVISAEWSSTRSRGTMMAAVFLMQSLGQLAAYGFGLAILTGVGRSYELAKLDTERNEDMVQMIDIVWRVTIGIGAAPALVSLFLRRMIPETPLFLAAHGHVDDAAEAAGQIYPHRTTRPPEHVAEDNLAAQDRGYSVAPRRNQGWRGTISAMLTYLKDAGEYLSKQGRWQALLGVMATWWLLDLAYYGIGLDNPKTISIIWLSSQPKDSSITDPTSYPNCITDPTWRVDPSQPNITIYDMLYQEGTRGIATITSGTLTGSAIILLAINHVPRTTWMGWMFVALAALFAINGGTFFVSFETDKHALTLTLYVLAQVLFNLGPNTMTFILPAELFGTKYRATFYGLAAASGKLGAIVIQLILNLVIFKENMSKTDEFEAKFAGLLLGLVPAMLLGAFITWVWIPEVQYPRGHGVVVPGEHATADGEDEAIPRPSFRDLLKLPNRPLEEIDRVPGEGQNLGMRRSVAKLFHIRSSARENDNTQPLMTEVERAETDQPVAPDQRRGPWVESDLADGPDSR